MSDVPAVAIVGMSGRFPGARDLDEYWANLAGAVCSIADFEVEELIRDGVPADEARRHDYVPAKGFLPDADRFEAELFGFNRAEAALLDPQHRVLLETAWSALEHAGRDPRRAPERTGVYVGCSSSEHALAAQADRRLAAQVGAMQVRILTGAQFLAPWLSYRLGLQGPSLTVQAACATSLAAVHLAVQALLLGECDFALAGGVSIDTVRKHGYTFQPGGILSPDGRCRPFDEKSGGTVPGSGAGLVVLRRLEDALADGDPILAVLRGSAITNDGSAKAGFTAPSVDRQTAAIAEAWASAGLEPSAAQYLEMHGTATELGDRIEAAATAAALGGSGRCAIGSVKSNIGHLDAAAGIAALIKTVLMLRHRTLAPTVNVTGLHGESALGSAPFDLVTRRTPWEPRDGGPRLAGVTGIGIGGTNVHVVVAEAPERQRPASQHADGDATGAELLPVSARTEPQLIEAMRRLAAALRRPDAPSLRDVAHTLRAGRARLDCRAWVVASTAAEAAAALEARADAACVSASPSHGTVDDRLAALGEAWARGEDVAWPQSAPGARRVHLPTYPFAGEHRGSLELPGAAPDSALAEPAGPAESAETTEPAERAESDATAARTAAIIDLLADSLGLDGPAELDRTFLDAGGDSMTAVHVLSRLRDEFDLDAPIELFLERMDLRELVDRIGEQIDEAASGAGLLASLLDDVEAHG